MDQKKIEFWRKELDSKSDDDLVAEMHSWVEHSERHLAAKLILQNRQKDTQRNRFHLIFWPSLTAAVVGILAFALK